MYGRCILDISSWCATFKNVDDLIRQIVMLIDVSMGYCCMYFFATCTDVQFVIFLIEKGAYINCHDVLEMCL